MGCFIHLILPIELIEIDLDRFVGMSAMFGSTKRANERVIMAFGVETDQVDLLAFVAFLLALDIFYYVTWDLLLH